MSQFDPLSIRRNLVSGLVGKLQSNIDFHENAWMINQQASWRPTFAQSVRINALLEHDRIIVADDTGINGKTFTGVGSKFQLDRVTQKRNCAFIIAPNSGLCDAWSQGEINFYAQKVGAPQQKVIAIQNYSDLGHIPTSPDYRPDFVAINWEKLAKRKDNHNWLTLEAFIRKLNAEIYILDECHRGKSLSSLTGRRTKDVIQYTIGKKVLALSATPAANRHADLAMVFHMLDPIKYPHPEQFAFSGSEAMAGFLAGEQWYRLTRDQMRESLGMPTPVEEVITVGLTEAESLAYFTAWQDCVMLGQGLSELRKLLIYPTLSPYSGPFEQIQASKIIALERLVNQSISDGRKVVVKSNLVHCGPEERYFLKKLVAQVGAQDDTLVIHSQHTLRQRKEIARKFREQAQYTRMFCTPASEESVSFLTGDIPCDLYFLEPDMTPRAERQITGRVDRRGQRGDVRLRYLLAKSDLATTMMQECVQFLARRYGIKIPKKFKPRFIDEDMFNMRVEKNKINDKIYACHTLTRSEEKINDANTLFQAAAHFSSSIQGDNVRKKIGPFELATLTQAAWRNIGEEQYAKLVQTRGYKKWKQNYEEGHQGSASQISQQVLNRWLVEYEKKVQEIT